MVIKIIQSGPVLSVFVSTTMLFSCKIGFTLTIGGPNGLQDLPPEV